MFLVLLWLFVILVLYANGLTTAMWVCIAVPVVLFLLMLLDRTAVKSSWPAEREEQHVRIDHPHYITNDEYECGTCGRRFGRPLDSCPYCGVRFSSRKTDETEYEDEEDEEMDMDEWDEEG